MATDKAAAQRSLWDFIAEISEQSTWQPGPDTLADLFAAMCYFMHPAYSFSYMFVNIFPLCLEAMGVDEMETKKLLLDPLISQQLCTTYTRVVSGKISIGPIS
jgi:hypothetical protein